MIILRYFIPIICLVPLCLKAQLSGSGAINNYAVFCTDGSNCIDNSNPIDTFMITAPDDGDLLIDVTFSETFIECCGSTTNFGINAELKPIVGSSTLFRFDNGVNTGPHTIKCMKKNETVLLIFAGQKGNFQYTVTHIPTEYGIDTEPNNDNSSSTAAPLNISQEGNVGYGIYSSNKDFRDWYIIAIDEDGDLEVDVTFNEPINIIL